MIYQSIHKLPLNIYLDALIDGDYLGLSDEDIDHKLLWNNLYSQYISLIRNPSMASYNSLVENITKRQYELKIIHMSIYSLSKVYNEELIDILKYHGYNYSFDFSNQESYLKDLDRCRNRSNALVRDIEEMKKELEGLTKGGDNKPITRESVSADIAIISKFMGYAIDENNTTAGKYASMINLYHSHYEQLQKNAKH